VKELLRFGIKFERLLRAISNVGYVAQGRRQVPLEGVGVQIFGLAAANGVDEVSVVISPSLGGRSGFPFASKEGLIRRVAGNDHDPFGAIEDSPNGIAAVFSTDVLGIADPVTDLEDQHLLLLGIMKGGDLGIRRLLIVIKHEMIAHGLRSRRKTDSQSPA